MKSQSESPARAEAQGVEREPQAVGVPLAQAIPRHLVEDPALVVTQAGNVIGERLRVVAAQLERTLSSSAGGRCLVVTSAVSDEGKTLTAINVALALAENRDCRTLLVDGDLRRPSLHRFVTPEPALGLAEVLQRQASLDHALVRLRDSALTLLPGGKPQRRSAELLRGSALAALVEEIRQRFDFAVFDAPPAVPFPDAVLLADQVDGALLVLRAGRTARSVVERAIEVLGRTKVVGAVLNDFRPTLIDRYYYRYDEYDPERYVRRER